MAFKRINAISFMADGVEDLKNLPSSKAGAECFVIENGKEYKCNNKGEWVDPKSPPPYDKNKSGIKRINAISFMIDNEENLKDIPESKIGARCYCIANSSDYICNSKGEWIKQPPQNSVNPDWGETVISSKYFITNKTHYFRPMSEYNNPYYFTFFPNKRNVFTLIHEFDDRIGNASDTFNVDNLISEKPGTTLKGKEIAAIEYTINSKSDPELLINTYDKPLKEINKIDSINFSLRFPIQRALNNDMYSKYTFDYYIIYDITKLPENCKQFFPVNGIYYYCGENYNFNGSQSIKMGWFMPLSDGYIPQNILRTSPVELSNEVKTQTCKNIDAVKFSAKAQIGQTIVVKSVDANGIPTEWEATDAMVINSSTEGSTKKFKITVDDSGTIAAIEV